MVVVDILIKCIDFVTISTLGNAADFGDLTTASSKNCAASQIHSWYICWWRIGPDKYN